MPAISARHGGTMMLFEMEEFASFAKGTQRYIRRSLDVGLQRRDAVARWARSDAEAQSIRSQYAAYRPLDEMRDLIGSGAGAESTGTLLAALVPLTTFDLAQGKLDGFADYRFLYERLIGAGVRPWLPSVFCAAVSLPQVEPKQRGRYLESVVEAAACDRWSAREPAFLPAWVEKVDVTIWA